MCRNTASLVRFLFVLISLLKLMLKLKPLFIVALSTTIMYFLLSFLIGKIEDIVSLGSQSDPLSMIFELISIFQL